MSTRRLYEVGIYPRGGAANKKVLLTLGRMATPLWQILQILLWLPRMVWGFSGGLGKGKGFPIVHAHRLTAGEDGCYQILPPFRTRLVIIWVAARSASCLIKDNEGWHLARGRFGKEELHLEVYA